MGRSDRAPVDAEVIRESYNAGLNVWAACPEGGAERELLRDLLVGHVQLLLPEVEALACRMRGFTRSTAVHVLIRGRHVIEEGAGPGEIAQACYVQDLAGAARALLALCEQPGPLGPPRDREAISEALQRRVCGACNGPIAEGEAAKRVPYDGDSGVINGLRHIEDGSCPALVEERRAEFHAVP